MVQSIVFASSNPSTMYMSTDTSQVWKSIDSGSNWKPVRNNFISNGAVSLAVSPQNENIVFAAGSYGTNRKIANKYPNRIEGIYRTTDGGANWSLVKRAHFYRTVVKGNLIAFLRNNNIKNNLFSIIIATNNDGLLVSYDMGNTWKVIKKSMKNITDIYTAPLNRIFLYIASKQGLYKFDTLNKKLIKLNAGFPDRPLSVVASPDNKSIWVAVKGNGIFKSSDSGLTFTKILSTSVTTLAISPIDQNILFAKGNMSNPRVPLVSYDGGISWIKSVYNAVLDQNFDKRSKQFWFSSPIAPHPLDKNIVFTVSNGKGRILKSIDLGKHWEYSGNGFTGARMLDAGFISKTKMVFAITDHGLWVTNTGNKGPFKFLKTPRIFKMNNCSAVAEKGNTIVVAIGGWKKQILTVSHDNGITWRAFYNTKGHYKFIGFNLNSSAIIYAGRFVSYNNGTSWNHIKYDIRAIDKSGSVYAVGEKNKVTVLMKSIDDGITWLPVSILYSVPLRGINSIQVSSDMKSIYLASSVGLIIIRNSKVKIIKGTNGLDSDMYGLNFIEDIAIDRHQYGHLYVGKRSPGWGQSNGVFFSDDSGNNWKNITGDLGKNLTVWSIKYDSKNCNIYIGTSLGIFRRQTENRKICNTY